MCLSWIDDESVIDENKLFFTKLFTEKVNKCGLCLKLVLITVFVLKSYSIGSETR